MMQDRTKKILALIAAVVIVAAAGLAGVVAYLVGQSEEKLPTITAYSKQETATVVPGFCDPSLQCEASKSSSCTCPRGTRCSCRCQGDRRFRLALNVQIGNPKTGEIYEGYRDYKPGDAWAVTVPGAPGEHLISAIIQLPAQGGLAPVWALQDDAAPVGGVVSAPAS